MLTSSSTGTISRDVSVSTAIEWEVPNFFDFPEEVDHGVESPEFLFCGSKWYLRMYPYGDKKHNSAGWIGLYLARSSKATEECCITFRLGIRTISTSDYKSMKYKCDFRKSFGYGNMKVIQKSALNEDMSLIAPQGSVVFFCTLHAKVDESKEAESQTSLNQGHIIGFETLSQNLRELFDGQDGEIGLNVKGEEFKAHKALLKARSPVFKAMFENRMTEDNSNSVEITDCDPTAFKDFLKFLYCGKIEKLTTANMFELYFITDKYDVVELRAMCVDFLIDNISMDNFFDAMTLALKHNEPMVLKHATSFFIENVLEIIESVQWFSFQKENQVVANELVLKMVKNKIPK